VASFAWRRIARSALVLATTACAPGRAGAPADAGPLPSSDASAAALDARANADAPTDARRATADAPADLAAGDARACATLALCDDFEGAAAGGPPDPSRWIVGAPDVTGTGTLAIDDAQHHSGARSVKVVGEGGYSNHIFFTNSAVIAALGPVVWARFYVRLSDALGDGHVTFLAMKDAESGADGTHLRMGGQSKILMWNRESDDATLPALSPAGIALSEPLPTNQWLCIELMVDGGAGALQTWVDGVALAGLQVDATPTPDVDEQWLRDAAWRPALTDFALGWESYGGQAMTLWFDDVALDAARIGCL
jgi:hypothetical protein